MARDTPKDPVPKSVAMPAPRPAAAPEKAAPAPVVTGAARCKLLERMEQNPRSDWGMDDVETLCRQVGLEFKQPRRGSHFKVFSKKIDGMLTIPARKPIKPVYIKQLVGLADAHRELSGDE